VIFDGWVRWAAGVALVAGLAGCTDKNTGGISEPAVNPAPQLTLAPPPLDHITHGPLSVTRSPSPDDSSVPRVGPQARAAADHGGTANGAASHGTTSGRPAMLRPGTRPADPDDPVRPATATGAQRPAQASLPPQAACDGYGCGKGGRSVR
jgi:hypothetical protein